MDELHRPHGRNLRKGRVSLPGHAYMVTITTHCRVHCFVPLPAARAAVRALYHADVVAHARTLAFVVMPDHVHWLLQLEDNGCLSEAVRHYKSKVSIALGGSVWQKGFYDRGVRKEDDLRACARYLVANPVRAGLVERVHQYPHWDAIWL